MRSPRSVISLIRNGPRARTLAVLCIAQIVMTIDLTVVNVALGAMGDDLGTGMAGLQWVLDAYAVTVGSLLIMAGSTADRIGRRRVLVIGLVVFAAGSALCSTAWSLPVLVAARVIQGVGASMVSPSALALVAVTFPQPRERARALGIWGVVVGLGFALGPVIGGALVATTGWRGIFWINVPICLTAAVLIHRFVPESRPGSGHRLDPVGQLLVVITLGALVYGLIEGPGLGWSSATTLAVLAGSGLAAVVLVIHQTRRDAPLIDFRFLASAPFSAAMVLAILAYASLGAFMLVVPLVLQQAHGRSPFVVGLCLIPLAVGVLVGSLLAGRLVAWRGARPSIALSFACLAVTGRILTDLDITTPLIVLLLVFLLFGLGFSFVNLPVNVTSVTGLPAHRTGQASAMAGTSKQVGVALGVALAGTITGTVGSEQAGPGFDLATRPIWFLLIGVAVLILVVGFSASSAWALRTTDSIAHLFRDPIPVAEPPGRAGAAAPAGASDPASIRS